MASKITPIGRSKHALGLPSKPEPDGLPGGKVKFDCRDAPALDEEPEEGGGTVDGECILVPEREYELRYVDYETAIYYGSPKVVVHYVIIEPEQYAGLPVDRFYNVTRLIGPPGRFGKYVASHRGNLFREFKKLIGHTERLDRLRFAQLKGQRVIGEIQTVKTDHKHQELPEDDRYSRIKRLLHVLPSDDW